MCVRFMDAVQDLSVADGHVPPSMDGVLRGVQSLAVLLGHVRHFYYDNTLPLAAKLEHAAAAGMVALMLFRQHKFVSRQWYCDFVGEILGAGAGAFSRPGIFYMPSR